MKNGLGHENYWTQVFVTGNTKNLQATSPAGMGKWGRSPMNLYAAVVHHIQVM